MFLGDFQAAGGTVLGLHRIVEEAKYNIYECMIKVDDIETSALLQEHVSGATILGFKEKDMELKVIEKISSKFDTESKKLISKRTKWLGLCSILKTVSICIILYYVITLFFGMSEGITNVLAIRTGLGVVFGVIIRQLSRVLQRMYINILPAKI